MTPTFAVVLSRWGSTTPLRCDRETASHSGFPTQCLVSVLFPPGTKDLTGSTLESAYLSALVLMEGDQSSCRAMLERNSTLSDLRIVPVVGRPSFSLKAWHKALAAVAFLILTDLMLPYQLQRYTNEPFISSTGLFVPLLLTMGVSALIVCFALSIAVELWYDFFRDLLRLP